MARSLRPLRLPRHRSPRRSTAGLADNSVGRLIEWLVRVWRCLRWTALSSISQHRIVAACGPALTGAGRGLTARRQPRPARPPGPDGRPVGGPRGGWPAPGSTTPSGGPGGYARTAPPSTTPSSDACDGQARPAGAMGSGVRPVLAITSPPPKVGPVQVVIPMGSLATVEAPVAKTPAHATARDPGQPPLVSRV